MTWHYLYSGLKIASALHLPEWTAFETEPFESPDVRFSIEEPKSTPPVEETHWLYLNTEICYFQIPEVAVYTVSQGNHVVITPVPGAGMREARLFLLGSAWGALCYQRDLLPLHASVIRVGDGAVAFCGASGAGKSSTAAWLLERGYGLVSDDLCVCHFSTAAPPAVWPSATRLKLWNQTLEVLGWDKTGLERDHFRNEKFHLSWDKGAESRNAPVPLRAIYLLKWGELSFSRLSGSEALQRVVENVTYRPEFIEPTRQVPAYWNRCLQLVSEVPVWEFERPKNWDEMSTAMDKLISQW